MVFKKTARYTFVLLTAIQVVFAVIWAVSNVTVVPDLPVCRDYIDAANKQMCDEFMSIYYTWFVRFILLHTSTLSTFAPLLYLFQLALFSVCSLSFARAITNDVVMHISIMLFIVSNPLVLSTIMQVSPASIHLAILLWVLSLGADEALLREKQIYGSILGRAAKWAIFIAIAMLLYFANSKLTVSGSMGRCEKSIKNYELQRFVWPHFNEITYTFYLEQTGYDSSYAMDNYLSPEYMWDKFVPSLYEHYGEAAGREVVARYVDEFGFSARTKENVIEWGKDIAANFFAPYTVIFNMKGLGHSHTGSLYENFVANGFIGRMYWKYSCMFTIFWTAYSLIGMIALYIIKKVKRFIGMQIFFTPFSINAMLFAMALSFYVSFFTLRGFDYRNALWVVIMWPLLLLFPFLSDDYR